MIGETIRRKGHHLMELQEDTKPATRRDRMNAMDTRTRYFVLASARIAAGLLWLANLHWKVAPNFGEDTGGGLYKYTRSSIHRVHTFPSRCWFGGFLEFHEVVFLFSEWFP